MTRVFIVIVVACSVLNFVPAIFDWRYDSSDSSALRKVHEETNPMHEIRMNAEFIIVLAASVALAIPMALQVFSSVLLSIGPLDNESVCYIVVIFSLFLSNSFILLVALPLENSTLMICATTLRYILVLYGAFGFLWHSGIPIFRSKLVISTYVIFNVGLVLSNYFCYMSGDIAAGLGIISNLLLFISVASLTFFTLKWLWNISKVDFDKLTISDYSCTGYIVLLVTSVYSIFGVILSFKLQSTNCMYYLVVIEAVFTVLFSIVKSLVDQKKLLAANIVSQLDVFLNNLFVN